eukprot:CAMPEP_0173202966 /NCGR_PEP_ID=MMETSP1141-20130122/19265_1 /TAXON_ID=483371 /ORGANISM="non described non described, Strain CCMP2298" /LENGTH=50 /DNA_ID=CAMNT_0014128387 /DNA_START=113 /DNA_END=261 /DNA_ORIENTATION=+
MKPCTILSVVVCICLLCASVVQAQVQGGCEERDGVCINSAMEGWEVEEQG